MIWILLVAAFLIWLLVVVLFSPHIEYRITAPLRVDSDEFLHVIQATCEASVHRHNPVKILTNGAEFYPAMRDAILRAQASVNLAAYIFHPGEAADMLIEAMTSRARSGVEIRLVLDSIGSAAMGSANARRLREAGLPGAVLSAHHVVSPPSAEQPHPPRTADRGRPRRLHGGRLGGTGGSSPPPHRLWRGSPESAERRPGATPRCGSRGRLLAPYKAFWPKTGSSAAARS